jgi:hypothetical protein
MSHLGHEILDPEVTCKHPRYNSELLPAGTLEFIGPARVHSFYKELRASLIPTNVSGPTKNLPQWDEGPVSPKSTEQCVISSYGNKYITHIQLFHSGNVCHSKFVEQC